jgi:hypothetical protein
MGLIVNLSELLVGVLNLLNDLLALSIEHLEISLVAALF